MPFDDAPTVTVDDLGTYLNDSTIKGPRAEMLIQDATTLCRSVVDPLPVGADAIIRRIAGDAYVRITQNRNTQAAEAGSPFGGAMTRAAVWLSRGDKADLRRLAAAQGLIAGSGGAFSINMLPDSYGPQVAIWDANTGSYTYGTDIATS